MGEEQDTRHRLLRAVWAEIRALNSENVRNYPAAARAIDAGAAPEDVATAMTAASYESAFRLLFLLSAEHAEDDADGTMVGWTLAEVRLDDANLTPTGSEVLSCIHEDLLSADPTGREGQDLFR